MNKLSKKETEAFTKAFLERVPLRCTKCKGKNKYIGAGKYECFDCGNIDIDDFGLVKEYIDEHGATPAVIISDHTGVPVDIINAMLKQGRLEIPEGSPVYARCETCGCSIKYGRFCPECMKKKTDNLKGIYFNPEVGERPKSEGKRQKDARMHFLNNFDNK
ncbi:MAG: hypothetical protein K5773_10205 [Pseudobutyrivibrio sp.]|nr:hypothetical protein [Pseudobutyrivibrio sp.]